MGHWYVEGIGGGERMTEICKVPESNLLICPFAKNPGDRRYVINIILGRWAALAHHSNFKQVIMRNVDHLDVNESNLNSCDRVSN